ncbi:MAG: alanine-zipper protein [Bacteroidota bacterium]
MPERNVLEWVAGVLGAGGFAWLGSLFKGWIDRRTASDANESNLTVKLVDEAGQGRAQLWTRIQSLETRLDEMDRQKDEWMRRALEAEALARSAVERAERAERQVEELRSRLG